MEIVNELTISRKRRVLDESKKNKKIHRKGKRSDEEQRLINSLIKENNEIYKRAKARGHALSEEKVRCMDIRLELIRMKAI